MLPNLFARLIVFANKVNDAVEVDVVTQQSCGIRFSVIEAASDAPFRVGP